MQSPCAKGYVDASEMASQFKAYGVYWQNTTDPASLHLHCISAGGTWTNATSGELAGGGLVHHYKEFIRIVWPWVVQHRWFDLILENYVSHRTVVLIGPASSGKTFMSALLVLVDYFAFPDCTTVICCSTTKERLQDRVWADVTKLFKAARKERPWLPGNIIEGRLRIVTDSRKDSPDGRDFRNGCVGVPCKRGDSFVGLSDFAGIKNKRVRLLGDELSLLPRAFCDAISNLDKNRDFKCIGLGNPKDTTDALGVLGEPAAHLGGWEGGIDQQFGTKTWPIRREGGIAIQLPGDDSPNLDGSLGIDLIDQAAIDRDVSFYGKDSLHYTMFNLGRMPKGQGSRRVLTRQLCLKYNAMDEPVWRDSNIHWIAFLDAAYRGVGGDRCVFGVLGFGYETPMVKFSIPDSSIAHSMANDSNTRQIIALKEMMLVPIDPGLDEPAEYQIAKFVQKQCEERNIPPEDFFYDAGMRTGLVSAFSKTWGSPGETIDCGGTPTDDPVSSDIKTTCREYYSKFVTQLWFNVRHAVESGQVRGLTEDVIMEFSAREWMKVGNNKTEVEPKDKVKEKTGRSPDLADAVAVGFYGATKRGFQIARLKAPPKKNSRTPDWRDNLRKQAAKIWESGQLEYASS